MKQIMWIWYIAGIVTAWIILGSILIAANVRSESGKNDLVDIDDRFLFWFALPAWPFAYAVAFCVMIWKLTARALKKLWRIINAKLPARRVKHKPIIK